MRILEILPALSFSFLRDRHLDRYERAMCVCWVFIIPALVLPPKLQSLVEKLMRFQPLLRFVLNVLLSCFHLLQYVVWKLVLFLGSLVWLQFFVIQFSHICDANAFDLLTFWFHFTHVSLCFLKVTKLFFDVCPHRSWRGTHCYKLSSTGHSIFLVTVIYWELWILWWWKFWELISSDLRIHLSLHETVWCGQRHHVKRLEPGIGLLEFWKLALNRHVRHLVWFEPEAWRLGTQVLLGSLLLLFYSGSSRWIRSWCYAVDLWCCTFEWQWFLLIWLEFLIETELLVCLFHATNELCLRSVYCHVNWLLAHHIRLILVFLL